MNNNKVIRYFSFRRIIVPVIIGLGISLLLIIRDTGGRGISLDLGLQAIYWFLVAFIFQGIRDIANMIRLRILTDGSISWRNTFQAVLLWEFANAVTPAFIGGSAIALYILRREGLTMGKSTAVVMIIAMLDELFFILVIPFVFLTTGYSSHFIYLDNLPFNMHTKGIFYTGYIFIIFLILTILTGIFLSPGGFKKVIIFIFRLPFLRRWSDYAIQTGDEIISASVLLRKKSWWFWILTFSLTVVVWSARFLVVNALITGFNPVPDHLFLYGRQAVMWVILMISPTPGGSGIAEYIFPQFFGVFIAGDIADIVALLWRTISYYPYLLIGTLILPFWYQRVRHKKQQHIKKPSL